MKLTIDISELIQLGKKMLPEGVDFFLDETPVTFSPIDIELSAGKEVSISDLDSSNSLISYQGRQVLLYIRDHTGYYDAAIADGDKGKRFHIAWCEKLDEMRKKNRFDRYHVTNRIDGLFEIDDGLGRYQDAELKVCKLCLKRLNYKGSVNYNARKLVFIKFTLDEFFSHYSTCFRHMPKGIFERSNSGYVKNWKEISRATREKVNYICNDCGVNLNSSKKLCDVHHKNGVKYDNSAENLVVLCKDCHRKQPLHGGIFVTQADMEMIQQLRYQQGLLKSDSWESIYALTDPSVHGDINIMQQNGYPLPVTRLDIRNNDHKTAIIVEAAWPKLHVAVNLTSIDVKGWEVFTVGELVKEIQAGVVFNHVTL